MIPDEIILDMHRETQEQTKTLGEIQSDIRSLSETTQIKFQVVGATMEDHKTACKRKWKLNNYLWLIAVGVVGVAAAVFYDIPILKGLSLASLSGIGGWTIKEWVSES